MTAVPGRTIAIGYIHGCSLALRALVDALRPGPDDLLVPLGDYINRGPGLEVHTRQVWQADAQGRLRRG